LHDGAQRGPIAAHRVDSKNLVDEYIDDNQAAVGRDSHTVGHRDRWTSTDRMPVTGSIANIDVLGCPSATMILPLESTAKS
jgi:hypothetical protein